MNMHAPVTSFVPAADTSKELRKAFSRFATGVTVVTAMTADGPVGMTVNSFASLSLDPPLTLWSLDNGSDRFGVFMNAEHTAIHVLSRAQEALCLAFAQRPDAFDTASWTAGANGVPMIDGCLARFVCRRFDTRIAGDHTILMDQVLHASMQEGEPLIFCQGAFAGIHQG